jgi:predicted nucleotide-binding protein
MNRHSNRLLRAIFEKTGGPSRAVRDVTELDTGLTDDEARAAWRDLLDQGLITKFSQIYAARITEKGMEAAQSTPVVERNLHAPKVVVVHGHDTPAPEAVALFLEEAGFEPIKLHGPSIMEQVEKHGEIALAILLLTAADLGGPNVLMELGYFMGRFGRTRVCALAIESTGQLPSHFGGVTLELFDHTESWKTALTRHLQSARHL